MRNHTTTTKKWVRDDIRKVNYSLMLRKILLGTISTSCHSRVGGNPAQSKHKSETPEKIALIEKKNTE